MPTAGQIAYRKFLKSDFWKGISAEKKRLVGKCEQCGSTRHLQAHHITYPEDWYDTTLDHLQILCGKHHSEVHGFVFQAPRKRELIRTYREGEHSFNVYLHWIHYLGRRIYRERFLKESEIRYLSRAIEDHPPVLGDGAMAYQVARLLADNEAMKLLTETAPPDLRRCF